MGTWLVVTIHQHMCRWGRVLCYLSVNHTCKRWGLHHVTIHPQVRKWRNGGPCHHKEFPNNLSPVNPRDRISAGFNGPGQCLQWFLDDNWQISLTLLVTYCFQGFLFLIQYRTDMESVQKTGSIFLDQVDKIVFTSLTRIKDPNNSRQGIDCFNWGHSGFGDYQSRNYTAIRVCQSQVKCYCIDNFRSITKSMDLGISRSWNCKK